MSHLFVNHHFFYESSGSLLGPSPNEFRNQIKTLKNQLIPAKNLFDGFSKNEIYFSITIDDGSKTVLDIIDILNKYEIHVCICICGNSVLAKEVLGAHKINLLRNEIGDGELYINLKKYFSNLDFDNLPLRGSVNFKDLYRYDNVKTRKLKIALNYKLKENDKATFINSQFYEYLGLEEEWAKKLYLSVSDLDNFINNNYVELVYHGTQHKLWKDLKGNSFDNEINPPEKIKHLFEDRYILSIPYGMEGSFDKESLVKKSHKVKGAFTMGRSIKHEYDKVNDFWWIHRYDQADIFNYDGSLKMSLSSF